MTTASSALAPNARKKNSNHVISMAIPRFAGFSGPVGVRCKKHTTPHSGYARSAREFPRVEPGAGRRVLLGCATPSTERA